MLPKQKLIVHGRDAWGAPISESVEWQPKTRWQRLAFWLRYHLWSRWRIKWQLRTRGIARW